jgi:hypothetical protein
MKDQIWMAEFRGLFWGEGCADIQRYHRDRAKELLYRPRLRMQLREDDGKLLEEIQAEFGGTLNRMANEGQRSKPALQWTLANKEDIVKVCDILMAGRLPAKKRHQIKLVREAAYMRAGLIRPITPVERTRLRELYEMLQQMKRYE